MRRNQAGELSFFNYVLAFELLLGVVDKDFHMATKALSQTAGTNIPPSNVTKGYVVQSVFPLGFHFHNTPRLKHSSYLIQARSEGMIRGRLLQTRVSWS